jgi:hypothetical protein
MECNGGRIAARAFLLSVALFTLISSKDWAKLMKEGLECGPTRCSRTMLLLIRGLHGEEMSDSSYQGTSRPTTPGPRRRA